MKYFTRLDAFRNIEEVLAFYEWAREQGCKTGESVAPYLARYKKPDIMVEGHKEHIEAKLMASKKVKKL